MNAIEETEPYNCLFIICPFCQLEYFLRAKFGEKVFFYTVPGGVLNFHTDETFWLSEFLRREQITDIYLVNDVSCNFIEEAINGKQEFGLNCERQFRELLKKLSADFENLYLKEKKELLAKTNVLAQLDYLKTQNFLKDEIPQDKIRVHGMITDKNRGFEILS